MLRNAYHRFANKTAISSSFSCYAAFRSCSSAASESTTKPSKSSTTIADQQKSFFVPVHSLLRLGEPGDLIRRALETQNEDQLVATANNFFAAHKRRMALLRERRQVSRFRLLKKTSLNWKLRFSKFKLYTLRCKVRGWAAAMDLIVLSLLVSFAAFIYTSLRALHVWMKRQQQLEEMTDQITSTVTMLEAHGNDGEKIVKSRVARGEKLPMPEDEKNWHLYAKK